MRSSMVERIPDHEFDIIERGIEKVFAKLIMRAASLAV